jgi:hypothetical protein
MQTDVCPRSLPLTYARNADIQRHTQTHLHTCALAQLTHALPHAHDAHAHAYTYHTIPHAHRLYCFACQGRNENRTMSVYARPPYYPHFRQASGLNPLTHWDAHAPQRIADPRDVIEVVTVPNNPDSRCVHVLIQCGCG